MASSPTLLILLIFTVTGTTTAELTQNFFHQSLINHGKNSKPNIPYKTQFFPQLLDHFTFKPQSYKIFYQKYLINKKYWNHGGPIFVYTGNEGDIDWFAANTGFMLDIAPKFQALLVFIEHRFYGESLPFGKDSYKSAETLGYLNSQQALADFAVLIRSLKQNLSSEASPVVVFGGSYGGMLSVWFRMKYPHLAIGAVASSAPILQFDEIIPWTSFYDTVSQDYKDASWNCYEVIKGSWAELQSLSTLKDGMSKISKIFRTCKNLQSVYSARDWLWKVFVYTAMANYPTEANFMMPLPAYPVTKMCKIIDGFPPKATKLNRVLAAANLYYNYTGTQKCFDLENRTDNHGLHGWNWQSCTEMVMPMTTSNDSMFPPITFNIEELGKFCMKRYGAMPRPHWITTEFGGYRFEQVLKRFGSNIIFSNGMQDPWSRGRHGKDEIFIHPYQSYARTTPSCVLKNISDSIIALVTEKGAHHVDFRFARKDDPDWLVEQRRQEVGIIQRWIDDYYADLSFL